jgi:hypothetical protein
MSGGIVVVYKPEGHGDGPSHMRISRDGLARRLAALKGFDFAGEYNHSSRYSARLYFVPDDTIIGLEQAQALGIRSEDDLFGGVVPYPFVATKAITHPLIAPDACAPADWSHALGHQIRDVVLLGLTAFAPDDARRAGRSLLAHGPLRIKPAREIGGHGQVVVSSAADLDAVLDAMDPMELRNGGVVLEEDLSEVTTYSIGQVRVAGFLVTYYGTQRLTEDNAGAAVYGGSDLVAVRGDFDALLGLDPPQDVRLAITLARAYDAAVMEHVPRMFASRRNYDVVQGLDPHGHHRFGVLEQSWRIGGASSAEIAALEAFKADAVLSAVRTSSFEVFGTGQAPPPGAAVYFHGMDEQIGSITKYATVEQYVHS